jgi:DNA-binding SARP family transcriptional activator/Tfp pilus assembly protein PilF
VAVGAIRFRLLGPVTTVVDGRSYSLARAQTRGLFAYLLLNAGRPVSMDAVVDAMWGGAEPSTARSLISNAVGKIRQELARLGEPDAIVGGPFGYQVDVDPERVDALALERGLRRALADKFTGTHPAQGLHENIDGWGGRPLQDAAGAFVEGERARLTGLRLSTIEELADVELSRGQPMDVIVRLTSLVGEHPLRERLRAQLMTALYRCGRAADALQVFRAGRACLVAELGIEPGPELQSLHERILSHDPDLARPQLPTAAARSGSVTGPSRDVPRQLPAPPRWFTARTMELAELDKIHDASTVVITAIDGMAGVGKTALAVQAAHQMVERYPDGQLFLDLHGYTEGVAPVEPAEALQRLLRSLGVPGDRIPAELDQREGLYRSRLAEQRVLIVLDNAATDAQVRPLVPGAPGCMVLVTSRRRLTELDHTHTLSLDVLPPADAVALLRHTAGEHRLTGQPPDLVDELVELCGRLPLAIRIAAARLGSHQAWDLAHLVTRLRDRQHRLVELQAGQRSITAALDLSYQDLNTDQRRTYRLLGLHVGPDVDVYAAAALLDATLREAGRLLEQLLEAHLLQEPTPGRYRFHDLTRAHAAHIATRDETQHDRNQALDRLLDHYRHTAAVAMDAAYPHEPARRLQVPPAHTPTPSLATAAVALDWLDSELVNLLAAARHATDHDRPTHLLHLSSILLRHLRVGGPYRDAEILHHQALTTARATGHHAAAADALIGLGHIHRIQGRHGPAVEHYEQALQLARASGYQVAEPEALVGLGHLHRLHGRTDHATDHFGHALQLARAAGHRVAELDALVGLGHIRLRRGCYEEATDHYRQALQLARVISHRTGELNAIISLAAVHRGLNRHEQAIDDYQQALQLARAIGNCNIELAALTGLGLVHRVRHQYEEATDDYRQLLVRADESGGRNWQFEAWQGLGRIHLAAGQPEVALTHHTQALALASELDQPRDQARAHDGLGHAHQALRQQQAARTHWQQALDILTRLGSDHTDDPETNIAAIRSHLQTRADNAASG